MVKLKHLLTITFFISLTFFANFTFAKPKKQPPRTPLHAEPKLLAAIKKSEAVLAKYNSLNDLNYSKYPGYFLEIRPKFEKYQQECNLLKEAFTSWTHNNTGSPIENLMWQLPGMVFDLNENEDSRDVANSFVVTATNRISEQEKSIRQEMNRINKLVDLSSNSQNFLSQNSLELYNSSSTLLRRLQEVIVKLNYTTAIPPTDNVSLDQFAETIFANIPIDEQLEGLVELETKLGKFMVKLGKIVNDPAGTSPQIEVNPGELFDRLTFHNQRFRYLEFVVNKEVRRANKTFGQVVKGEVALKAFVDYLRSKAPIKDARKVVTL